MTIQNRNQKAEARKWVNRWMSERLNVMEDTVYSRIPMDFSWGGMDDMN